MQDNQMLKGTDAAVATYLTSVVDWANAAKRILRITPKQIEIAYKHDSMEVFLDKETENRIMGYSGWDEAGDELLDQEDEEDFIQ